jgi:S1-C subfamily serine protease
MAELTLIDAASGRTQNGRTEEQVLPDAEALDAYSRTVSGVAERLAPSVANLRVSRRVRGGRRVDGGGSGVVITPDGYLLTSAHVVAGTGTAAHAFFVDGREVDIDVVGADLEEAFVHLTREAVRG